MSTPIITSTRSGFVPAYLDQHDSHNPCTGATTHYANQHPPAMISYVNYSRSKLVYQAVPHFRKKIKSHRDATGPYHATLETREVEPGGLTCTVADKSACAKSPVMSTSVFNGCFFSPPTPSQILGTDLMTLATSQMRAQARGRYLGGEAEGLVVLGEVRETLRMLSRPMESMTRLCETISDDLRSARTFRSKRSKRKNRKYRQKVSQAYLEYTFGLKPLIQDAKEIAEAAASMAFRFQRITGKGVAESGTVSPGISVTSLGGNACYYTNITTTMKTAKAIYRGERKIGPSDEDTVDALNRAFGLTPNHIMPALWELIPFSFVIDYFANVGDFLEALSAGRCFMLWGCESLTYRNYVEKSGGACGNPNQEPSYIAHRDCSGSPGGARGTYVDFSRSPSIGIEMPTMYFRLPGASQVVNMSALVGAVNSATRNATR